MGPQATVIPALLDALSDDDFNVRYSGAGALGKIGPAAKNAIPALIKTLNDDSLFVRAYAAIALPNTA